MPDLWNLMVQVGKEFGTAPSDLEPYLSILRDNWFDSPESLSTTKTADLAALGIPLRFAQCLQEAAVAESGQWGGARTKANGKGQRKSEPFAVDTDEVSKVVYVKETDPAFSVRAKILGARGSFLRHIQDESGALVELRERDSSGALSLEVHGPRASDVKKAAELVDELLESVYTIYAEWLQQPSADRGWGRTQGDKGKGKKGQRKFRKAAEAELQQVIDIEETEELFHFRSRVLGESGRNLSSIQQDTGCLVDLEMDGNRPKCLRVGGATQAEVEKATAVCEDLLGHIYGDYDRWRQKGAADSALREPKGKGKEKGGPHGSPQGSIDFSFCDPDYSIRSKALGEGGAKVKRIEKEAGVRVTLSRPTDDEPMRVSVAASDDDSLAVGMNMVEELRDEIMRDYELWLVEGGANGPVPAGRGREKEQEHVDAAKGRGASKGQDAGKGRGKGKGEFKKVVRLRVVTSEFPLRSRLTGDHMVNIYHIQDTSDSKVWISGGNYGKPLQMEISAHSAARLDKGVRMCEDLVQTVYKEYDELGAGNKVGRRGETGHHAESWSNEAGPKRRRY